MTCNLVALCVPSAAVLLFVDVRVSVSRAIRPFGNPGRPEDWFSQKVCNVCLICWLFHLVL